MNISPSKIRFVLVCSGVTTVMVMAGWVLGQYAQVATKEVEAKSQVSPDRAILLYQTHCSKCHGARGRGDGPMAEQLKPHPRDFGSRPWRFDQSTESISRLINWGLPSSSMPSFQATLSDDEIQSLAQLVSGFATAFSAGPSATPKEQTIASAGFRSMKGGQIPPFTFSSVDGKKYHVSEFAGRLLLLHFWSSSSEETLRELTPLGNLQQEFAKDRLQVLHICTDETDPYIAQNSLSSLRPGIHTVTEVSGLNVKHYVTGKVPGLWLIDPQGNLIAVSTPLRDVSSPSMRAMIMDWLPKGELKK